MAVVENRFVCDLSKPVQAQALKGNVFSLDNLGSRISVLIYDNGQPATISGSVTANCILPDGSTVNVNGGLTTENGGSKAYVDIPQSCLLISGILKIAIKCTSSSVITTLAAIVANVYMTKTDNIITPSQQVITDWNAEISAAIATQNAAIANQDTKINDLKSALENTWFAETGSRILFSDTVGIPGSGQTNWVDDIIPANQYTDGLKAIIAEAHGVVGTPTNAGFVRVRYTDSSNDIIYLKDVGKIYNITINQEKTVSGVDFCGYRSATTPSSSIDATWEVVLFTNGDIQKLNKDIQQLYAVEETVDTMIDTLPKRYVANTVVDSSNINWESGKFYYASGTGEQLNYASYASLYCMRYGEVKKDDVFYVTAASIGSGYAIYLTDENNVVLDYLVGDDSYYDNKEYVVPSDGIMYLNTSVSYITNNTYSLKKKGITYNATLSSMSGIKWASFGDSLCEFNRTANKNWIKDMIESTNVVNTNLAASGTGFYRGSALNGSTPNNYIAKISSLQNDVQFISVCGSFNDLSASPWESLPVGTASDTGTTSIAGYMNAFFDELLTNYPTIPVAVCMTSPWAGYKPGVQASDDYVNVLKEICLSRGIPFNDDCYKGCNLRPWVNANKTEYYTHPDDTVDGTHPNDKGHVFIYRMLKPFLEKCVHSSV